MCYSAADLLSKGDINKENWSLDAWVFWESDSDIVSSLFPFWKSVRENCIVTTYWDGKSGRKQNKGI